MAKLANEPAEGFSKQPGEDFSTYYKRTAALLSQLHAKAAALPEGTYEGVVLSFPIADGAAMYLVQKTRPLTLQHIPYGDAWYIPAAHLRGLSLADVQAQARRSAGLSSMFGKAAKKVAATPVVETAPGFEQLPDEDFSSYMARTDALFEELLKKEAALPDGTYEGVIMYFPAADGHAMYLVQKAQPLTLMHLPVGDAWQVSDAHLRGLTLEDVKAQAERTKGRRALFARKT